MADFVSVEGFLREFARKPRGRAGATLPGPVAVIFCESRYLAQEALDWDLRLGARAAVLIGADPPPAAAPFVHRILRPAHGRDEAAALLTRLMPALEDRWILHHFNGEFALYPYFETRRLADFAGFMDSERRRGVFACALDLYDPAMRDSPGLPPEPHFDAIGYYAEPADIAAGDGAGRAVYGGLTWRREDLTRAGRVRIDRVAFFRARKGLRARPDFSFGAPDTDGPSCPWHHNPTMALMSFRAARSLLDNPGSCEAAGDLRWAGSRRFGWSSSELIDAGFMEPGQWV